MATTLDCPIMGNYFGTARMRHVFDTRQLLQSWFEVWACLAEAEAEVGIIPTEAAEAIRRAAESGHFDANEIAQEGKVGRHLLLPAINALAREAGDAGRYVHWGSTTQDITDTGAVLQIKAALDIVEPAIRRLIDILIRQTKKYGDLPMAGRTHWQHAVPITLGLKLAQWIEELQRHSERLAHCRKLVLVAQIGGAGGTMASMGPKALAVRAAFCRRIGLGEPDTSWFGSRDRLGELVSVLGMVAATIEKIDLEVGRLASTEINELREPRHATQVGSSTMPQKHNPIICEQSAAGCKIVRGMVSMMLEVMVGCHERDWSSVAVEALVIPQAFIVLDGALQFTETILDGLQVFPERMAENLAISKGGINAEAVMYGLARSLGRTRAHDIMVDVARKAGEGRRDLIEVLLEEHREVTDMLSKEQLAELVSPQNHLGIANEVVEKILSRQAGARTEGSRAREKR
jgi:3-carboxy-cis,cis-muconate cycloisomerase